jgi:hypothetical protein
MSRSSSNKTKKVGFFYFFSLSHVIGTKQARSEGAQWAEVVAGVVEPTKRKKCAFVLEDDEVEEEERVVRVEFVEGDKEGVLDGFDGTPVRDKAAHAKKAKGHLQRVYSVGQDTKDKDLFVGGG